MICLIYLFSRLLEVLKYSIREKNEFKFDWLNWFDASKSWHRIYEPITFWQIDCAMERNTITVSNFRFNLPSTGFHFQCERTSTIVLTVYQKYYIRFGSFCGPGKFNQFFECDNFKSAALKLDLPLPKLSNTCHSIFREFRIRIEAWLDMSICWWCYNFPFA